MPSTASCSSGGWSTRSRTLRAPGASRCGRVWMGVGCGWIGMCFCVLVGLWCGVVWCWGMGWWDAVQAPAAASTRGSKPRAPRSSQPRCVAQPHCLPPAGQGGDPGRGRPGRGHRGARPRARLARRQARRAGAVVHHVIRRGACSPSPPCPCSRPRSLRIPSHLPSTLPLPLPKRGSSCRGAGHLGRLRLRAGRQHWRHLRAGSTGAISEQTLPRCALLCPTGVQLLDAHASLRPALLLLSRSVPCSAPQAFSGWMHVLAVRLFVESILRYGLPPQFLSALVRPHPKHTAKLRKVGWAACCSCTCGCVRGWALGWCCCLAPTQQCWSNAPAPSPVAAGRRCWHNTLAAWAGSTSRAKAALRASSSPTSRLP